MEENNESVVETVETNEEEVKQPDGVEEVKVTDLTESEKSDDVDHEAQVKEVKDELDKVKADYNELLSKQPKEKSKEEIELENQKKELFDQKIAFEFEKRGLSEFAELISITDAKEIESKFEKLQAVINSTVLKNSYVPTDHKQEDAYSAAVQDGDYKKAMKEKLGSFLKWG
ncbi:hypothetical protein [Alkalihalobacillus sp. 1P02AB]|uniref:hypothetical protein n=1 Tax=Alkalihalobacillus sp. 1P02AB TaxID=3132260 RepID=UPI0039A50901